MLFTRDSPRCPQFARNTLDAPIAWFASPAMNNFRHPWLHWIYDAVTIVWCKIASNVPNNCVRNHPGSTNTCSVWPFIWICDFSSTPSRTKNKNMLLGFWIILAHFELILWLMNHFTSSFVTDIIALNYFLAQLRLILWLFDYISCLFWTDFVAFEIFPSLFRIDLLAFELFYCSASLETVQTVRLHRGPHIRVASTKPKNKRYMYRSGFL